MKIHDAAADASSIALALEDKLYQFNVEATGFGDGEPLCFVMRGDDGEPIAGLAGHTWGRCCDIKVLWVERARRRQGLGTALMEAAEAEAVRRSCAQILLFTHSFQAPSFYERLGFRRAGSVPDYPLGHDIIFYVKTLTSGA